MGAAVIRAILVPLLLIATTAAAQDFSFRQDCQLVLMACDILRDGDPATCPVDQSVTARFWAEGDAFYLGTNPADGTTETYALGQGYYTDAIRIYYVKDHPTVDGMFWIAANGNSGAQFSYDGLEDYFSAVCTPQPD